MNELDLTDWSNELDRQISYEKQNNEKSFRACRKCGDKGFWLSRNKSSELYYLCMNYCDCNIGSNLRQKHITKDVKE